MKKLTNATYNRPEDLTSVRLKPIIGNKDRWIPCPRCGRKRIFHLLPGTTGENIAIWCRQCKREIVFHIAQDDETST